MPPASRMGEQNRWASAARSRLPSWAPQASACVPKGAACRRTGAIEGNVTRPPAPSSPGGMRGPRSQSKIGGRGPRAPERGCPRGHLEPRRACRSARRADALARSKGTSGAHLRLAALAACAGRGRGAKSVGERAPRAPERGCPRGQLRPRRLHQARRRAGLRRLSGGSAAL